MSWTTWGSEVGSLVGAREHNKSARQHPDHPVYLEAETFININTTAAITSVHDYEIMTLL